MLVKLTTDHLLRSVDVSRSTKNREAKKRMLPLFRSQEQFPERIGQEKS
jgi:hypothetical protein